MIREARLVSLVHLAGSCAALAKRRHESRAWISPAGDRPADRVFRDVPERYLGPVLLCGGRVLTGQYTYIFVTLGIDSNFAQEIAPAERSGRSWPRLMGCSRPRVAS